MPRKVVLLLCLALFSSGTVVCMAWAPLWLPHDFMAYVLTRHHCATGDEAKENQDPGMLDASVPLAESNVAAMVSLADRPSCAAPQSAAAALPARPEFEELD